jgi:hypothetical protein
MLWLDCEYVEPVVIRKKLFLFLLLNTSGISIQVSEYFLWKNKTK